MIPPDEIAHTALAVLASQSLYILQLFRLIWGLAACCRGRYPRWQDGLWLLILLGLVLPPDTAAPWSASQLLRTLTPQAVPRQYVTYFHEFSMILE